MNEASGQRRRRIGRITVAVLGGLLLLATLLPLVVRGPVARWAVARATANLCGKFEISGGHLGWAAVWQLLLGRPTELALRERADHRAPTERWCSRRRAWRRRWRSTPGRFG